MIFTHDMAKAIAQLTAAPILDSLVIGFVLAAFAWLLLRVLPRQSSATRFTVWFAALAATAVLPWVDLGRRVAGSAPAMPSTHALIAVPGAWAMYLFAIWIGVAAVALARLGIGFVQLSRIRSVCRPVPMRSPGWPAMVERACPGRPVEILCSDRAHVPTAIGFSRPAVVIPASLLQDLSDAELQQVLLHELAHLRRRDDWTNLVQKIVKAVLFFHPAVWWMESRISLEREMACDDAVLAETASPRSYAQCLALLAEKSFLRRSAELEQAAVNRIRHTTLRVARILDVNRSNATPVRRSAVALVVAFACACALAVWQAPQLVVFQDAPPALARSATVPSAAVSASSAIAPSPVAADLRLAPIARRAVAMRQQNSQHNQRASAVVLAKHSPAREARPLASRRESDALNQPLIVWRGSPTRVHGSQGRPTPPQVVQAKAVMVGQPVVTTGVMLIVVDDPVFGPTPTLWRFAVWQITMPQYAPQAEPAIPQKTT